MASVFGYINQTDNKIQSLQSTVNVITNNVENLTLGTSLEDVSIINPANLDILQYVSSDSKWENKQVTLTSSLNDLTDVTITTPSNGDFLRVSGTGGMFVNSSYSPSIASCSDATIANIQTGQFLRANSSSKFVNSSYSPSIASCSDVTITNLQGNQMLLTNSSGQFINSTYSPTTSLSSLTDCTIVTPLYNQNLTYDANTNKFINKAQTKTIKKMIYKNTDFGFLKVNGYVLSSYCFIDTSVSSRTITLALAPTNGSTIKIGDANSTFSTHPCTILPQTPDVIVGDSILNTNAVCSQYLYNNGIWTQSYTVDNYMVLTNGDDYIEFDNVVPLKLYLPLNPVIGQVLSCRDLNFSSVQPITIWGNSKIIDGASSYVINIDKATVHFYYDGNGWISSCSNSLMTKSKGDILTFSTSPSLLSVGSNGQVITADSTQTNGIKWATPSTVTAYSNLTDVNIISIADKNIMVYDTATSKWINKTGLTTKGDLLTFDTGMNRLPVGTNNYVLTADSTQSLGIKWAAPEVDSMSVLTDVTLTSLANKNLLVYNSATSKWLNKNGITTKGDILTFDTDYNRLAVGTDGYVLKADSTQALGIKWGTDNLSNLGDVNITSIADKQMLVYDSGTSKWINKQGLTTKGDLLTYSTTLNRLGVGTNNYSLIANSSATNGINWGQLALNSATTFFSDVNCSAIANKDILRYNTTTSKFENSPSLTTLETSVNGINTTVTTTCNVYKTISATQNATQLINYDDVVMSEPMAYVNNSIAQLYTPIHAYVFGSSSDGSIPFLYGSGSVNLSSPARRRISYDFVNTSFTYVNVYFSINSTACDLSVYGTNDAGQFTSNDTSFSSNLTLLGGPTHVSYGTGSSANIPITNTNTYRYLCFLIDTTAGSYGANIDTLQVTIGPSGVASLYTGTDISVTNDTTSGNPMLTYLNSSSSTVVMDYNKIALYRLCKTVFPVCRSPNSIYLKTDGSGSDYSIINHNGFICTYDNTSTYTALIQGVSTLNDTTITSVQNNDMLVYSSGKWVNSSIPILKLGMLHGYDGITFNTGSNTSTISIDNNGWTTIKDASFIGTSIIRFNKNGGYPIIEIDDTTTAYKFSILSFGSTIHILNGNSPPQSIMRLDKGSGNVEFAGTVTASGGLVNMSAYVPASY